MVGGQPVAYAKLRSTYFHEADSARAFAAMNEPSQVQSATDFQHVMSKINFTFNWFYVDDKDIAYFNSGDNPVRASGTDPEFPAWGTGQYDWQGWDPVLPEKGTGLDGGTNIADYTPAAQHPQVINQDYISSWNNKQAPGYRAAEDNYSYGPNHRVQSAQRANRGGISGGKKMSLADLISAMEDGGSVDLRGSQDLLLMLDVIESSGSLTTAESDAVGKLRAWVASGAHRRDNAPQDGHYDNADAIALMDAWWPKALEAAFKPTLGTDLFGKVQAEMGFDDPPGAPRQRLHLGLAGLRQQGPPRPARPQCAGSVLPRLRRRRRPGVLPGPSCSARSTPHQPVQDPPGTALPRGRRCFTGGGGDSQMCHDAIHFKTVGAVSVKPIEWINRRPGSRSVEVQGHRGAQSRSAAGPWAVRRAASRARSRPGSATSAGTSIARRRPPRRSAARASASRGPSQPPAALHGKQHR